MFNEFMLQNYVLAQKEHFVTYVTYVELQASIL